MQTVAAALTYYYCWTSSTKIHQAKLCVACYYSNKHFPQHSCHKMSAVFQFLCVLEGVKNNYDTADF